VDQPRDKFDADALPDPELNPLLNPLLAAHMGRWAEVYFTNPPEKRGEAVAELLRELRSRAEEESAPVQQPGKPEIRETGIRIAEDSRKACDALEAPQICSACSAANAAEQKFCGMCGALLRSFRADSSFGATAATPQGNWGESESSIRADAAENGTEAFLESGADVGHLDLEGRRSFDEEWSIPEADVPSFGIESESVPYRYRLYLGVAMAVLLSVLVYMGWHRTKVSSEDASESRPARSVPAAPAPSASTAQAPAATRKVLPTDRPVDTARAAPGPNQQRPETSSQAEGASQKNQAPRARAASPRIVQVAAASPIASEPSGAEELAMAEKYLNNQNAGVARDSREAAQWLWKAVGKGNLAAAMALSDLYLKGDGVPKSCDQARLLLDAAAKKGKAWAGERLRNLQAFGCQ